MLNSARAQAMAVQDIYIFIAKNLFNKVVLMAAMVAVVDM